MAGKKKEKIRTYVITGTDLELHEVNNSKELNALFHSMGIEKHMDSSEHGAEMYTDETDHMMAFVMRGGEPVQLNTSIEFHLDADG